MRFSLKRLLLATTIIAFFAFAWTNSSPASAIALAAAGALLLAAMHWRRKAALKQAVAASLLSILLIWMASLDRRFTWSLCPSCMHVESVTSLRLLGYPLTMEKNFTTSVLELIAADLGIPCRHSNIEAIRHNRDWGLMIRQGENGTIALTDDSDWHDSAIASRLRKFGQDNPQAVREYQQRVLLDGDKAYLNQLAFSAGITNIDESEAITLADAAAVQRGHDLLLFSPRSASYSFPTREWIISYERDVNATPGNHFWITIDCIEHEVSLHGGE